MITKSIKWAVMYAKTSSKSWGVAYIHKFPDHGHLQVSIAQGSGKYVIGEYQQGKRVKA